MKVRVIVTVDINADAWMAEYGVDREDVRSDAVAYVSNAVAAHMDQTGMTA